jgi:hypothetical protein
LTTIPGTVTVSPQVHPIYEVAGNRAEQAGRKKLDCDYCGCPESNGSGCKPGAKHSRVVVVRMFIVLGTGPPGLNRARSYRPLKPGLLDELIVRAGLLFAEVLPKFANHSNSGCCPTCAALLVCAQTCA